MPCRALPERSSFSARQMTAPCPTGERRALGTAGLIPPHPSKAISCYFPLPQLGGSIWPCLVSLDGPSQSRNAAKEETQTAESPPAQLQPLQTWREVQLHKAHSLRGMATFPLAPGESEHPVPPRRPGEGSHPKAQLSKGHYDQLLPPKFEGQCCRLSSSALHRGCPAPGKQKEADDLQPAPSWLCCVQSLQCLSSLTREHWPPAGAGGRVAQAQRVTKAP